MYPKHRFWTSANKPETKMGVKVFCLSVQQLSAAQSTGSSNWHGWTASENESWQTAHGSQRNAASTDKIVHTLGHAPLDSVRWCLLCRISRWNQFLHYFAWTIPLLKRVSCAWWIAILSKWGICHCLLIQLSNAVLLRLLVIILAQFCLNKNLQIMYRYHFTRLSSSYLRKMYFPIGNIFLNNCPTVWLSK